MALSDYQLAVQDLVPDQDLITPALRDRAIASACQRYGADVERVLVEDVAWQTPGHEGPLPQGWVNGCYLQRAEYPIGHKPASLIALAVYVTPMGSYLTSDTYLAAGAQVRVSFAAPHVLTPLQDTIALHHRDAVAAYAASLLCQQLATRFSSERETAVGADVSQTESRARAYAARAKEYRALYFSGVGLVDPAKASAGAATSSGAIAAASVTAWPGRVRRAWGVQ